MLANVLWALIPLPVAQLFDDYTVFAIILARFLPAGVVTCGVAVAWILGHPTLHLRDFRAYLGSRNARFFGWRQWQYLGIFGATTISLQVMFFFYGMKLAGFVLTFAAYPVGIILVAFYNWGQGREDMDLYKWLYLFLLFVVAFLIGFEKFPGTTAMDPFGLACVVLLTLALAGYSILTDKDVLAPAEEARAKDGRAEYRFARLLVKMGVSQLVAAGTVIVVTACLLPAPEAWLVAREARLFYTELPGVGKLVFSGPGAFLVIGATILPYFLWFYASTNWPREALSFDQWSSILNLVDPALAMVVSVVFLADPFSPLALLLVLALMGVAIALRYVAESQNVVHASVLVQLDPEYDPALFARASRQKGVLVVQSLLGYYDLLAVVKMANFRRYTQFLLWLQAQRGVRAVTPLLTSRVFK